MSILATIDALHRELDAHPAAHGTRLILADALEEAGEEWAEMAEGYRAMGAFGLTAHDAGAGFNFGWCRDDNPHVTGKLANPSSRSITWRKYAKAALPVCWFRKLAPGATYWAERWKTRREAEDAAALAFAKLPEPRRRELLATQPAEVPAA